MVHVIEGEKASSADNIFARSPCDPAFDWTPMPHIRDDQQLLPAASLHEPPASYLRPSGQHVRCGCEKQGDLPQIRISCEDPAGAGGAAARRPTVTCRAGLSFDWYRPPGLALGFWRPHIAAFTPLHVEGIRILSILLIRPAGTRRNVCEGSSSGTESSAKSGISSEHYRLPAEMSAY